MAEIIWTEPSLRNFEDIASYIAISNPTAAKKLVAKIFSKIERLDNHPLSGRKPPELLNLNYREILVNPCRVFYKYENDLVYILYIMRQEQDLRRFLLNK
jgi:toxin ParE1/3/4